MLSFFEKIVELMSMVQVALSPILIFTIIAIVCYFGIEQPYGFFVGILVMIAGIVLGVWYAIYIHKKRGATEFLSLIRSSPELDEKSELDKEEKK